jgi:hypothetical protein
MSHAWAWPTTVELESSAKALTAILGLLAGAWALATRWARKRRAAREKRELEGKAIRYLLDAIRHSLHVWTPGQADENRLIAVDGLIHELIRQKLLIDLVRDQLWVADGNESARLTQQVAALMTRAEAIRAKRERNVARNNTPPETKR